MTTTALAEYRSPSQIRELIAGFRELIADAVLEGENNTARRYAERVAILRDELLTTDELVAAARATAEHHRVAREAAPPHEDAPAVEAGAMTKNHQQEEQIMTTIPTTVDAAEAAWLLELRDRVEAIAAAAPATLDLLEYTPAPHVPTEVVGAIQVAQRRGLATDVDATLPNPPHIPTWAISTNVTAGVDGQVIVTHRGRLHDALAWIEQVRLITLIPTYHELGEVGTITEDSITVNWPEDLANSAWADPDTARRLAAALAAAVDELENAPRTVRRPAVVDEQLRDLEG